MPFGPFLLILHLLSICFIPSSPDDNLHMHHLPHPIDGLCSLAGRTVPHTCIPFLELFKDLYQMYLVESKGGAIALIVVAIFTLGSCESTTQQKL